MSHRRLAGHRKYPELLAEKTPIIQPQQVILLSKRSRKVKEYLKVSTWQIWPLPGNTAEWRGYVRPRPYLMKASLRAGVINLLWVVVWRCQTCNEWVLLLGVWFDVAMTTTTTPAVEHSVQAPAGFSQCFSVARTCCTTRFQGWERRRSSSPRDKTIAKSSQLPKKADGTRETLMASIHTTLAKKLRLQHLFSNLCKNSVYIWWSFKLK